MIVRADQGGLAALTYEAWSHLKPSRTLVVLARHTTRGFADLTRYPSTFGEVRVVRMMPGRADLEWLLTDVDVVYSAETWYSAQLPALAEQRCVRTVLHAMPELYDAITERADLALVPTTWRLDLVPGAEVLPVPVATERFTRKLRTHATTFFHIASSAMCDRNGTELLLASLEHVTEFAHLIVRGGNRYLIEQCGKVTVTWLPHHAGSYWEAWPADIDVFLSPRRFAGLSLPMQEAAAQGIPTISLDLDPQCTWIPDDGLIACVGQEMVRMKGGMIAVYDADPHMLAAKINELVANPDLVERLSENALGWADQISWDALLPEYQKVLCI